MAVYYNRSQEKAERLIKLRDYLYENASPTHAVKMADILTYLESIRYKVEIKTVYSDLKTLKDFFNVNTEYDGRQRGYLLLNPPFEPYELRSIVNSIQAAKFISQQEADSLTQKIMKLTDEYTRPSLNRQTYVPNRARSINEEAMRNLDTVYEAIALNQKICFRRFGYPKFIPDDWEIITVSPYKISWEDDGFYIYALEKIPQEIVKVEYPPDIDKGELSMISSMDDDEYWDYIEEMGYEKREIIPDTCTYRPLRLDIRHMEQIKILRDTREGKDFAQRHLGEEKSGNTQVSVEKTKLKVSNDFYFDIIDRFGNEAMLSPLDDKFFVATINQEPTPELYMWTREFYPLIKIIFPEDAEAKIRAYFSALSKDDESQIDMPISYPLFYEL